MAYRSYRRTYKKKAYRKRGRRSYKRYGKRRSYHKPEVKSYLDAGGGLTPVGMTSIPNAWIESRITDVITNGTGASQRIGNQVFLTEYRAWGTLQGGQTATSVDELYNHVRFMLVQVDSGVNSLVTTNLTATVPLIRGVNDRYIKRVYKDMRKLIQFRATDQDGGGFYPNSVQWSFRYRWKKPLKITWTQIGATPDKQIVFGAISDSNGLPNPGIAQIGAYLKWIDP